MFQEKKSFFIGRPNLNLGGCLCCSAPTWKDVTNCRQNKSVVKRSVHDRQDANLMFLSRGKDIRNPFRKLAYESLLEAFP